MVALVTDGTDAVVGVDVVMATPAILARAGGALVNFCWNVKEAH